jgi:hypothetical protein
MGLIRIGLSCAVTFALVLQSGCSFMFVKGPPANHAEVAVFDCSDSNGWPAVDAVWAALNGIGAISASNDDMNPQQGQIVAVGLAWLAVSGISAIYGFSKVSDCSKAKRLRDERYFGSGVAGPAPADAPRTISPPLARRPPAPRLLPAAAAQQTAPTAPAAAPLAAPAPPSVSPPPATTSPPPTTTSPPPATTSPPPTPPPPASPASPLTGSARPSPARGSLAMRSP